MHLGTARTAYFNWLAARASGGRFILRIDDTDTSRDKPEYVDVILDTMKWLGLDYDKLVFQSERNEGYLASAEWMIRKGCAKHQDGAIVFVPENQVGDNQWYDELSGWIKITKEDLSFINGMVLIKSNGEPTYHFASCIDDVALGINYIIRGHDHITNTSRHVYLFAALGYPIPKFAHVGLIHFDGRKLSKRDGAASILYYRDKGYDPDAVLNFMARLGWGPKIDDKTTKLLPRERMLELFLEGGKMRSSPANMDMAKLDSFNRKYEALKK